MFGVQFRNRRGHRGVARAADIMVRQVGGTGDDTGQFPCSGFRPWSASPTARPDAGPHGSPRPADLNGLVPDTPPSGLSWFPKCPGSSISRTTGLARRRTRWPERRSGTGHVGCVFVIRLACRPTSRTVCGDRAVLESCAKSPPACTVIDPHGSSPHRTGGPDSSPRPAASDTLNSIEPNHSAFLFLSSDLGPNDQR